MAENAIRFLLGGAVRTLADVDPNMTVLTYLRTVAQRTGTKEGCAEGDCGACTVVLGELDGDRIRHRAVNACILFLPVLDGKQLITVEDLKGPDGGLHPVQQAMVDSHGSQCGFCTPGIVMSLFALQQSGAKPARALIDDTLAGNLCRCTGYRPIVEAAMTMSGTAAPDRKTVKLLKSIQRDRTLALTGNGRQYFAPTTAADLAKLRAKHPDAVILAGGTDVGLWVTKQHRDLDILIYVGDVAELKTVRVADGWIEIGAAAPYTDAMAVIAEHYPDFGELIRRLGSVQIRNAGTIGGNLANASPIGDTMPALIALGATVVLRRNGKRRDLPLDHFYLGYRKTVLAPDEFIEAVRVPLPEPARRFHAWKLSKRFDQDISAVCGAYSLDLNGGRVRDIRICYGGMAATPKRAARCEDTLRGRRWSYETVEAGAKALAEDYAPLSDMRASSRYRTLAAQNLLRKFWLRTTRQIGDADVATWGR